jgi:hypothetical protein
MKKYYILLIALISSMDPMFAQSKENNFENSIQQMQNQMKKMMERMHMDTTGIQEMHTDTSFRKSFGFMNDGNGWQPLGENMDSTKMDNLFSDMWKNFQGHGFDNKFENLMDMFQGNNDFLKSNPFFNDLDIPEIQKNLETPNKALPLDTPKKKKYTTKTL